MGGGVIELTITGAAPGVNSTGERTARAPRLTDMKAAALLTLVAILSACARLAPGGTGPSSVAPNLTGTWSLQRGVAPSGPIWVPDGSRVTIVFDDAGVHGRACNWYGGEYRLDGSAIGFSAMTMTEMACAEPMMTIEGRFHQALAAVATVERSGEILTLSGPGAELVFGLQPQAVNAGLAVPGDE